MKSCPYRRKCRGEAPVALRNARESPLPQGEKTAEKLKMKAASRVPVLELEGLGELRKENRGQRGQAPALG